MIPYILFFIFVASLSLVASRRELAIGQFSYKTSFNLLWIIIFIFISLFIGLRFEVGGDWESYLILFEDVQSFGFNSFAVTDPGYFLLNWASGYLGLGIFGVNLICGIIFSLGLIVFCRSLPRPLLALLAATPYLIFVVAMGYTRQAAALGFVMIAFVLLGRKSYLKFLIFILLAATFHKSAVILLPISVLASTQHRILIFLMLILIALIIYYSTSFASSADKLIEYYIRNDYQSQGALVRILMLFVPAMIFLIWPHRFSLSKDEHSVWKICSWLSIILLILLMVSDASTAIDRIALYLLPLQIIIFSYLPEIFGKKGEVNSLILISIVGYFLIIMLVWFSFSPYSRYWLPYQNILFLVD